MNPKLQVRPREPFLSRRRRDLAARALAVVVLATAGFLGTVRLFDSPARVASLRFENPSDYDIHVTIAGEHGDGAVSVGIARQRCVTEFRDVIDPGAFWTLSFSAQGADGGSASISRDQVARDGWQLRIADEAINRLRASGAPSPPVHGCPSR